MHILVARYRIDAFMIFCFFFFLAVDVCYVTRICTLDSKVSFPLKIYTLDNGYRVRNIPTVFTISELVDYVLHERRAYEATRILR